VGPTPVSRSVDAERRTNRLCRTKRSAALPRALPTSKRHSSSRSDERLLLEIERLYEANFVRFARVAASIAGDPEIARDVVQDAFASVIRNRHQQQDGSLEGWVWRIVVNTARSERRKRAYAQKTEERLRGLPAVGSDEAPQPELTSLIAQLPERQRTILFLRYYVDLGYEQIAEALTIRSGTVGATLAAAHAALRSGCARASKDV
jgi:RNA polymerase sigma factor (sigma-70 family)